MEGFFECSLSTHTTHMIMNLHYMKDISLFYERRNCRVIAGNVMNQWEFYDCCEIIISIHHRHRSQLPKRMRNRAAEGNETHEGNVKE